MPSPRRRAGQPERRSYSHAEKRQVRGPPGRPVERPQERHEVALLSFLDSLSSWIDVSKSPHRIGASIATAIGGLGAFERCHDTLRDRGPDRVSPFSIPSIIPNMGAGWVSMELGTQGPLASQCTACAASNMAIGDGARRDPARSRGRDALRRHRGRDHAGRHRGLRRDARALAAQRRPEARARGRSTRAATAS